MAIPSLATVEFDGIVGFLDIAGFTAATERFGTAGARGTEALGRLINLLFTPAIAEVHRAGGEVGWFAGDAIGILFDRGVTDEGDALGALCAVSRSLTALTPFDTPFGQVDLGVKLGVAAGPVRWHTLGTTPKLAWYSGPPIDLAAEAEHHAAPGDVILHSSLRAAAGDTRGDGGGENAFSAIDATAFSPGAVVATRPFAGRGDLDHQPPRVARLARAGDVALLDQHRSGTALFVRLPGSTIDPGALARVVEIARELGGVVLSATEGDKGATAVVFFGAPTALADRQRRAVLAACAIRAEIPEVACGAASGRVFAGRVGSEARWDYSVLGDRVNTAARLMQAAAPGEVLVDQATLAAAGPGIDTADRRALSLKGKSEPERVSPVIAVADRASEVASAGPFVGRRRELDALRAALRRPGVTLVVGGAGIGKSRLVRHALADTVDHGRRQVMVGESDRLRPFGLWRRVLDTCGVAAAERAEQIVGAARAPFVDVLTGRASGRSALLDGVADEDRAEILASVIVDLLTATDTTCLLVEDLHWADGASIDQVARMTGRLDEAGIAFVATSRPDPHLDAVIRAPGVMIEEIDALGTDAIAELAGGLWSETFGAAPVATLARDLVERSAGSPLYCHQLVSWAAVKGAPADLANLGDDVPATINDLMLARLDDVPDEAEPAVAYGAVMAEPFSAADLTAAFGTRAGGEMIPGAVEILLDRALLVGFEQHRFAHALMREIAHGRLSFDLRDELHTAALSLLESRGTDDVGELARHAAETTDLDRQRRYFAAAARQAADQYANDVALDWYRRLLPLLAPPESGLVRVELGRLEFIAGRLDVASVLLADAIEELDGPEQDRARLALGRVEIARGIPTGFDRIDEVVDLAEQREDWSLAREGLETAADLATMLGDIDRAEAVAARHEGWVERLGSAHRAARPVPFLAGLVWMRGDLEAASARYEEVYEQFLEDGDLIHAGAAAADLGGLSYETGDVQSALRWLAIGAECFEKVGHERSIVRLIRGNEVFIRTDQGDFDGARRLGLAAAARALFLGDLPTVGEILAAVVPAASSLAEAVTLVDGAARTVRTLGIDAMVDYVETVRARALARFGAFEDAIVAVAALGAVPDDPELAVDLACWRLERGDPTDDAVSLYDELDPTTPLVQRFALADALARATGASRWADVAREHARSIVEAGEPGPVRAHLSRYLGRLPDGQRLPPPDVDEVDVSALIARLHVALTGVAASSRAATAAP